MDYQEAIEIIEYASAFNSENSRLTKALSVAISAMQELQIIHNNGINLERLKDIDFRKQVVDHINYDAYMRLMDELEEYKQIGTLDEVRDEVEKQRKVKPEDGEYCPICHTFLKDEDDVPGFYCMNCGQAIDWGEEE